MNKPAASNSSDSHQACLQNVVSKLYHLQSGKLFNDGQPNSVSKGNAHEQRQIVEKYTVGVFADVLRKLLLNHANKLSIGNFLVSNDEDDLSREFKENKRIICQTLLTLGFSDAYLDELSSDYCSNSAAKSFISFCWFKAKLRKVFDREENIIKCLFPNSTVVCDKAEMYAALKEFDSVALHAYSTHTSEPQEGLAKFCSAVFIPTTYRYPETSYNEISSELQQTRGIYIVKPTDLGCGIGIRLIDSRKQTFSKDIEFLRIQRPRGLRGSTSFIIQRYIEDPMLIDKRKFDLRTYLLVIYSKHQKCMTSSSSAATYLPFYAFFHPGFVKLSCFPYDVNSTNMAAHLTNQSVQYKEEIFKKLYQTTTWAPDELKAYFDKRNGDGASKSWVSKFLYKKARAISGYIAGALQHRIIPIMDTFEIYGCDFMADAKGEVYLLEINNCLSWSRHTAVLRSIKDDMWREALCIVTETVAKSKLELPVDGNLASLLNFQMVFSSDCNSVLRDLVIDAYGMAI